MSSNSFDGEKRIIDTAEHSTVFWRNTGYHAKDLYHSPVW